MSFVYGLALGKRNLRTIFQNPTDRDVLVGLGAVAQEKTVVIRGSGVDLRKFEVRPEPADPVIVLMAARLLRDKGVTEFVEAARQLKVQGINARFLLAGSPDEGNPSSFSQADLEKWRQEGNVEFLGYRSDMPVLLSKAHIVVLPSYREGLPRVLEEAAACGRAIVTTDVPGCRDAIVPGETGLLVPVRDAGKLAEAIRLLVEDAPLRHKMGESGRKLAERCYAVKMIVQAHLSLYQELLGPAR
ncbi:MAG: N,N'-diacetylbacillosaminyl-diphospho-undecaprenol alpha-1,3-N-acetylgalactosaminyltransferase [Betaproteobacteria bacterium ADurb.Bin341]|nr:MAG: N,N'-diacetylbacillosaminyl-diphospho-undecaprenol alpha-1,3-N-acetylgalactosaminyltransferase [Betaproteobacteria bacterium ADurb.Bin341]